MSEAIELDAANENENNQVKILHASCAETILKAPGLGNVSASAVNPKPNGSPGTQAWRPDSIKTATI